MALRVLLADESSTIKKVFQLALQDFGVEVRPVNVGVDVVAVAQTFKPDIIFADVLLQKRSGYDVAADIKQDASLNSVPVVLMWSGFMELDEDKFQACMANAQLEKPFDVSALRKLVTELVPRTQTQRLSQFLNFPKMPEMEEKPAPEMSAGAAGGGLEDFAQVPLPKIKGQADKYKLNLKPEELEPEHVPVEYEDPDEEPFALKETRRSAKAKPPAPAPEIDEDSGVLALEDDLVADDEPAAPAPAPTMAAAPSLSPEQLEKIIREQSAEVIESVVWKVVPDLAAQIIERELNKLLKERESQPY